jgi:hypothetical protein
MTGKYKNALAAQLDAPTGQAKITPCSFTVIYRLHTA